MAGVIFTWRVGHEGVRGAHEATAHDDRDVHIALGEFPRIFRGASTRESAPPFLAPSKPPRVPGRWAGQAAGDDSQGGFQPGQPPRGAAGDGTLLDEVHSEAKNIWVLAALVVALVRAALFA